MPKTYKCIYYVTTELLSPSYWADYRQQSGQYPWLLRSITNCNRVCKVTRVLRPRLFSPANPLQRGAGGITWWLDHLSAWNSRTITTQNIITEWLNPHSVNPISKSLPLPTHWVREDFGASYPGHIKSLTLTHPDCDQAESYLGLTP